MKNTVKAGLMMALTCCFSVAFAQDGEVKKIALSELYDSYVEQGYSSLSMPEFSDGIRVEITGVVIGLTQGFATPNALLSVSDSADGDELARLAALEDGQQEKKLGALPVGGMFTATCSVGFTSNTDWMSLQDCVFE